MNRLLQNWGALWLAFLLLPMGLIGQSSSYIWGKQWGNSGLDYAAAIAKDQSGNLYVTGAFMGTVDFDPGPGVTNLTSASGSDPFVMKLNSAGNLVWARSFAGANNEYGTGVAVDRFGNVFTTGTYKGTTDFDPGAGTFQLNNGGLYSGFISKLNSSGNFLWAKSIEGNAEVEPEAIAIDTSGRVTTVGYFTGTVDFDPGAGILSIVSSGSDDIFVQRLDSSGNLQWAKSIGSTQNDIARSVQVDASGSAYLVGEFRQTVDFDPGIANYPLTAVGGSDIFMMRISNAGNFLYAYAIGDTANDAANSIRFDNNGTFFHLSGYFGGRPDFDPGPGNAARLASSSSNAFVAVYNNAFTFQMVSTISGTGQSVANSATLDAYGNAHVVGTFTGTVDTDPGTGTHLLTSGGGTDAFYHVVDVNGNYKWSGSLGSTMADDAASIVVAPNGDVAFVGSFQNTVDFNMGAATDNRTALGGSDAYLLKMSFCNPTSGTSTVSACGSYTLLGQTYTTSGTYVRTLTNSLGCDSVLTLNLTIRQPSSYSITQSACDSLSFNGTTYTTSGNYTQTLTNAAGCDSTLSLHLTIYHPGTHTLTHAGCDSFSVNGQTYFTSGTYVQHLSTNHGCDSTLTIALTIGTNTADTISVTHCGNVAVNGQIYSTSGTYLQHLTNASGCDSALTVIATVNPYPNAGVTQVGNNLFANLPGATYQWLDCWNAFSPVPGATGQNFSPTTSGSYACQVTLNGCSATSTCFQLTIVGQGDPYAASIRAFPNPNNGQLHLDLSALEIGTYAVTVLSPLGQQIVQWQLEGQAIHALSLPVAAQGIYFLRVSGANGQMVLPILVEQ